MPTNKKEGIMFTSLMCFCMVFGMSLYNLILHNSFSWINLFVGLLPGFVVAFILDVFIVGVVAKKLAFKLPINKESKVQLILTISCLMVVGMVTFMSLFGILFEGSISEGLLSAYLTAWKMNLIAALPLQLLLVGPFSRKILTTVQNKNLIQAN